MITIYATTKDGEGFVTQIGTVPSWEDLETFEIRVGTFAPDVVITFEETDQQ